MANACVRYENPDSLKGFSEGAVKFVRCEGEIFVGPTIMYHGNISVNQGLQERIEALSVSSPDSFDAGMVGKVALERSRRITILHDSDSLLKDRSIVPLTRQARVNTVQLFQKLSPGYQVDEIK